MNYLFPIALLSFLLLLLWVPALVVAVRIKRMPFTLGLYSLRFIWLCQLIIAGGLTFLADAVGLLNPAGYVLAITLAVSFGGVVAVLIRGGPLTNASSRRADARGLS